MTIKVTEADIKNGITGRATCPVALAIQRKTKELAYVCWDGIYLQPKGGFSMRIATPKEVKDFVYEFDAGKPVKPFSFKL